MKKNLTFFVLSGMIVCVLVTAVWLVTVRQVRCVLNDHPVSTDVRVCAQLQELIGTRLLFHDLTRDAYTATLLYIEESQEAFDIQKLEKSLSGEITVYVTDQPPLYRIHQNGQMVLVTQAGGFRQNNDQLQVPTVVDQSGIYEREKARAHQFLIQLLSSLGDAQTKITRITLESEEKIKLDAPGFPRILLEINQDPARAAARIVLLLKKLSPETIDIAIQELDMRFELPVLRTFESSSSMHTIDSLE